MKEISILVVPYDSGYRESRMGRGPQRILESLQEKLQKAGSIVEIEWIELPGKFHTEITTAFRLNREIAVRVRALKERNRFPIVLSGNCSASIGAVAAFSERSPGVIWFDAHGDFNTPETTVSGYLDGMALATMTGRCWSSLTGMLPDFHPLPEALAMLVGARDLDPAEQQLLTTSEVGWIKPEHFNNRFPLELARLKSKTGSVHLHCDLDVLDPKQAPANQYAAPDGLSPEQLISAAKQIRTEFELTSLCVAAYDPQYDPQGKTVAVATDLILACVL